jgi:hypothetical protein
VTKGRKRPEAPAKNKDPVKVIPLVKEKSKYIPREEYNPRESSRKIIHTSLTYDAIRRLINLGLS